MAKDARLGSPHGGGTAVPQAELRPCPTGSPFFGARRPASFALALWLLTGPDRHPPAAPEVGERWPAGLQGPAPLHSTGYLHRFHPSDLPTSARGPLRFNIKNPDFSGAMKTRLAEVCRSPQRTCGEEKGRGAR